MAISDREYVELSAEETAALAHEIQQAVPVVEDFVRAVKAVRYYPADYPLLNGFKHELCTSLRQYVQRFAVLTLDVDDAAFAVYGSTVYTSTDPKTSVPFLLYRDGIRELRLFEGITDDEVLGLIDLIAHTESTQLAEDDLVTLLVEREYPHIDCLAVDGFLHEDATAIPETLDEFRERLTDQVIGHHEDDLSWEALAPDGLPAMSTAVTASLIYQLTPQEQEALSEEIHALHSPESQLHFIPLLIGLLPDEHDQTSFQTTLLALQELYDSAFELGDYARAGHMLLQLRQLAQLYPPRSWQTPLLHAFFRLAADHRRIGSLGERLRTGDDTVRAAIASLLASLPADAFQAVVQLLGDARDTQSRQLLGDVLVEIGKDAPELFSPFMNDARVALVRDLVKTLGKIGKETVLSSLARAYQHRDIQVRKAVVRALESIASDQTERLLIKAMSDTDEGVRCLAAISLGRRRTAGAVAVLLRAVHDKNFERRAATEIGAILDGVGAAGTQQALTILKDLLFHKPLLGRKKADEIRRLAAHALAIAQTPAAQAILQAGCDAHDLVIRNACRQALATAWGKE